MSIFQSKVFVDSSEQEAIRAFKRAECKLWIVQQELIQS